MATLAELLETRTREGELYDVLPDGRLRCYACGHCCPLPDGAVGVCKVRFNEGGRLRVPWGYVGGVQCDPIEKKPFFHALSRRAGLQLRHARLRSALRLLPELGDVAGAARSGGRGAAARHHARSTRRRRRSDLGARAIVSTYNEPLITANGPSPSSRKRNAAGLITGFVSNGNGTPEVLEYLRPWVDSLQSRSRRASTIATIASSAAASSPFSTRSARCTSMGLWLEIVTLLIPGFNDSRDELRA